MDGQVGKQTVLVAEDVVGVEVRKVLKAGAEV